MKPADRLPLTEQCHHYQGRHEVPWDIQKYFSQRYSIFSWYDQGICMTDDAWFGVTPEPVAKYGWLNSSLSERGADISRPIFSQVAKDMYDSDAKKTVLIDMFAGAGGNTIAFALSGRWSQIIAVEKDASTLACAQNNADVYGVERPCITWVHGDSLEFLDILVNRPEELHPDLRVDLATTVVFASPPWGGVGYSSDQVFDLYTMQPYDLRQLHNACYPMDHALYLPRSSDIRQIAKLAPEGEKIEVVQYCMEGASKAMVAYIPAKNIPEKS